MKKQIEYLVNSMLTGDNFEYFYRTRGLFEIDNHVTGESIIRLCLNELFAAEKDVSTTSMYRLTVDGKDMGKFKSSGILIATGTGSSGWLFSARQVTYHDIAIV
jgi:NAD kinase